VATPDEAPAAFLGHGSPMNTLERNRWTESWRRFGRAAGTPRGVLMISAHWYVNATAVTAMAHPRTIHEFYGFPRELSTFRYPAPGSPGLAEEVAELARPDRIGLDEESWGLDHGAWSVLAHAFPDATVPIVQLSINASKPFEYHMELASRLAPLRRSGVVIIGSGNLVHNLGMVEWGLPEGGFDWAQRFDCAARDLMRTSPADVADLRGDPDYRLAAPTPDHFIPLLYVAALAGTAGRPTEELCTGFAFGSVSMTSFTLDAVDLAPDDDLRSAGTDGAAAVPADQANI
jgi:4,5-DOPA dioxygenase extradiol